MSIDVDSIVNEVMIINIMYDSNNIYSYKFKEV
jgi:hypothetical protein